MAKKEMHQVYVRMPKDLHAACVEEAEKMGLTTSSWIVLQVVKTIRKVRGT